MLIWLYFKILCILLVYQSPEDTVTGDLFVSTISWDRQEHRGAGYRSSIPAVLQLEAATVTGRPQRARIRSGIFDFRSVQLYTLSNLGLWSLRLFLKIIPFYTYRGCQGYSNLQHTNLSRFLILLTCKSYY